MRAYKKITIFPSQYISTKYFDTVSVLEFKQVHLSDLAIVIPLVVRLYVEIIHELKRVDYLTYRWTNMV